MAKKQSTSLRLYETEGWNSHYDPRSSKTFKRILERFRDFEKQGPAAFPSEEEVRKSPLFLCYEPWPLPTKQEAKLCRRVLTLLTSKDHEKIQEAMRIVNRENEGNTWLCLLYDQNVDGEWEVLPSRPSGKATWNRDFFFHLAAFLLFHDGVNKVRQCKKCRGFYVVERGDHRYCSEPCRTQMNEKREERREYKRLKAVEYRKRRQRDYVKNLFKA